MSIEFKTVYPGIYDEKEQQLLDETNDFFSGDEEVLQQKLVRQSTGYKGIGGMELNSGIGHIENVLGRNDVLSANKSVNPRNPLYTDATYARNTKWGKLMAAPMSQECGALFPLMPRGTDVWISSEEPTERGLDHELTFHKPIFEGDYISSAITSQYITDITDPRGSKVRRFRAIGTGELRSESGEVLISGTYRGIETFKVPEDYSKVDEYEGPRSIYYPTYNNWDTERPRHVYTDEDYELMKGIWAKEYIRGSETLYWEDVNIGDEPAWTCDGPYTGGKKGGPMPGGMTVEARTVLMNEPIVMDSIPGMPGGTMEPPETRLKKDEYGIISVETVGGGMAGPPPRQDNTPPHPNKRASFQNTVGRNLAAKFVTNWMGDDGWLYKLCWRLSFCMDHGRNMFPENFDRPSYLLKVPYLKEAGKFMNTHGYVGDIAITKGYVCDKYIKDGKHYVDLVVWCEEIEGGIFAECYAVVELPSRSAE